MPLSPHWTEFKDRPGNPVLGPPWPEWMIADPTLLAPQDTPDGKWHLFANSIGRIRHYTSVDGYGWKKAGGALFGGIRPCVRKFEGRYYLFYERYESPRRSVVACRVSDDLTNWDGPRTILEPSFSWEGTFPAANGNPCLVSGPFGFRLYYSASAIWLPDCLFIEPKFIGVAESGNILGPYVKRHGPILAPSPGEPYRNFGAGAIKVFQDGNSWVGLNNGIYKDAEGRSRSAILALESDDGISFRPVQKEPILRPEGNGWKKALVYALDVARHEGELRLYYNGRSGWFWGGERIGVALARER